MNEEPEKPKIKMPPFSGGWRRDYALLAKQCGFTVQPHGDSIAVYHQDGTYLGILVITRDLQFPDALIALEKRKVLEIAKKKQDAAHARLMREKAMSTLSPEDRRNVRLARPYGGMSTLGLGLALAAMASPLFGSGQLVRPSDAEDHEV